jgi:endonuclease/exonuclease/phosphatase family metal-dependent hydrolase
VNRTLLDEFESVLHGIDWQIALLQEAPPRWLRPLAEATRSNGASALTARNAFPGARALLARLNPDLVASAEGGSNQTFAQAPWRIERAKRETLTRRPERRRMLLTLLAREDGRRVVVANLHASTGERSAADVLRAAELASAWANDMPLLFGGDLNARPAEQPDLFRTLEDRYGLRGATAPEAIDHVLCRGLRVVEGARVLPPSVREVRGEDGLAIRLSDHPCVVSTFEME